jgi:hypothetical protein
MIGELSRPPDVRFALMQLELGHAEGYNFHHNAYLADAVLRDWVHQPNYFTDRNSL